LKQVHRWEYQEARDAVGAIVEGCERKEIVPKKNDCDAIHAKIRRGLRPLEGEGMAYLRGRGFKVMPENIYFHPVLAYHEKGKKIVKYAAIVAPILASDGHFLTYHCTYLLDGKKAPVNAPRKIMPSKTGVAGGAVRLAKHKGIIGIAEGIETALAASEMFCIPTWAVLNTSLMEAFVPPEDVNHVKIFADNDARFAGQKAAYVAANRLSIKYKISAEVMIPEITGEDWLDVKNRTGLTKK
jgi:putative DNA primase/helicase